MIKKICPNCKINFIAKTRGKKFCSSKCQSAYRYKSTYIHQKHIKICIICKRHFETPWIRQRFCSKKCKLIYENKNTCLNNFNISTGALGTISELLIATDLMKKGFEIYRAVSPSSKSDLIAKSKQKLFSIEARTGRIKNNYLHYPTINIYSKILAVCTISTGEIHYFIKNNKKWTEFDITTWKIKD